ncbi:FlgO family outer membrane protein [Glaciecola sp. KUL10]|uniref:FlgO family outer membrane protein n=1 Tax=Glaciecola sp. (strain KUL10) TaxID=2161813 RepID=UPI000D78513A|nr:FlgO family outer membrane protein [Glaciecola sp. KUL10]
MKNSIASGATFLLCIVSVLVLISLSGCTLTSSINEQSTSPSTSNVGKAEAFTNELADELFAALLPDRQYRYAVAGFVPVDSLQRDHQHQGPLMHLGHQLEQGLTSEAVKRGFIAQDFKVANGIIIDDLSDRVFTRNVENLTSVQAIDFYISGTITQQSTGAMVNARVIDARTRDIIAAATQFFPDDLFWPGERVSTRNGRLYRSESFKNEVNL